MDKLNTAIADKVLEISSADSNEVRDKLQKINRFRDFINACQSLIRKYPEIETELLRMIHDNDFDARIASTRVDTIIRLSENSQIKNTVTDIEDDIHELEDIVENLPEQTKIVTVVEEKQAVTESSELVQPVSKTEDKSYNVDNRNIESKEPKPLPEAEPIDLEKESQYVDFEEISETEDNDNNFSDNSIKSTAIPINESSTDQKENPKTTTSKKIIWALITIAVIVVLYIIVKFIINHWNTILWILGSCAVVALIIWYFFKRKKQ